MKTIQSKLKIITIVILLFTVTSASSQDYAYVSTNEIKAIRSNRVNSNETLEAFTTYLLINSMTRGENFNYRQALRETRKNPTVISMGETNISSTELLKVFKRSARKTENSKAFKKLLHKKHGDLVKNLTEDQIDEIYTSFRSTTFNGLLDELHLAFASYP